MLLHYKTNKLVVFILRIIQNTWASETVKCGHEPRGTRIWEWLRWRGPAAIVNDRFILSSETILHKDYNSKCSVGRKKITGRESQGACRQDSKPPVVK
jgi:hypothetical protein